MQLHISIQGWRRTRSHCAASSICAFHHPVATYSDPQPPCRRVCTYSTQHGACRPQERLNPCVQPDGGRRRPSCANFHLSRSDPFIPMVRICALALRCQDEEPWPSVRLVAGWRLYVSGINSDRPGRSRRVLGLDCARTTASKYLSA